MPLWKYMRPRGSAGRKHSSLGGAMYILTMNIVRSAEANSLSVRSRSRSDFEGAEHPARLH